MAERKQSFDSAPILVVGHIRSGTKWLSNIICNHPKVAAVQSQRARGILETNMFHRMQAKFDLRSSDDYIGFIETWRKTEFVTQAGIDVDKLYELDPRPRCFVQIFEYAMQDFARRRGASFWLQKCDPERAMDIIPRLRSGPARIIVIRRDLISVVQSVRNMSRNRPHSFSTFKAVPGIARMEKLARSLERRNDVIPITYEQLRSNPEKCVRFVCEALGLEYLDTMLDVQFAANTSFGGTSPEPVGPLMAGGMRAMSTVTQLVPKWILDRLLRVELVKYPVHTFVSGTFGDLKNRLADARDY